MTQNGVVTRRLDNGKAEVSILRGTACGGNCGSCEACQYNSRILIEAENGIHADAGDRVVVTSSTGRIMGLTLLIYMLPLAAFFLCYAAACAAGGGQGLCIAVSLAGLALGALVMVFIGRRRKAPRYELTGYIR